jgi:hypothetical protein
MLLAVWRIPQPYCVHVAVSPRTDAQVPADVTCAGAFEGTYCSSIHACTAHALMNCASVVPL